MDLETFNSNQALLITKHIGNVLLTLLTIWQEMSMYSCDGPHTHTSNTVKDTHMHSRTVCYSIPLLLFALSVVCSEGE